MSHEGVEKLLGEGRALVAPIEDELRAGLAPFRFELDASVAVSDSALAEILVCAGRLRSRLIALGASRRTLLERVISGAPIERLLRDAPSDVAVYRTIE
jgi:nucleotide-binding universal stress UspA family protein